jgi:glutamine amidotransferase
MMSIIDYGSGNISAIATLAKRCNVDYEIVNTPEQISSATQLLLPGVGAFDHTMRAFEQTGMAAAVKARIGSGGASLLGICVGMQILASSSEEGTEPGLGLIPGRVRRFDPASIPAKPKLPHMGWNQITPRATHPLLANIDLDHGFYFLHSYYFDCEDAADIVATTTHGPVFHSMVGRGRVFGVQCHPEKSHDNGVRLIRNFLAL